MAKLFSISTDKEDIQTSGGGGSSFISDSGIYPVTIKFASVEQSKNGAIQVNFNIDYNGNSQTIWGPYITSNDGKPNKIGRTQINNLGIIAGMTADDDIEVVEETFNVGKDNKPTEFNVIEQFTDLPVFIRVQKEYSSYNGKISRKLNPMAFYRASDTASAPEIVNGTEVGKHYETDLAKYSTQIKYTDCTQEEAEAWEAEERAKREAAKGDSKAAAPKTAAKPAGSLFKK